MIRVLWRKPDGCDVQAQLRSQALQLRCRVAEKADVAAMATTPAMLRKWLHGAGRELAGSWPARAAMLQLHDLALHLRCASRSQNEQFLCVFRRKTKKKEHRSGQELAGSWPGAGREIASHRPGAGRAQAIAAPDGIAGFSQDPATDHRRPKAHRSLLWLCRGQASHIAGKFKIPSPDLTAPKPIGKPHIGVERSQVQRSLRVFSWSLRGAVWNVAGWSWGLGGKLELCPPISTIRMVIAGIKKVLHLKVQQQGEQGKGPTLETCVGRKSGPEQLGKWSGRKDW